MHLNRTGCIRNRNFCWVNEEKNNPRSKNPVRSDISRTSEGRMDAFQKALRHRTQVFAHACLTPRLRCVSNISIQIENVTTLFGGCIEINPPGLQDTGPLLSVNPPVQKSEWGETTAPPLRRSHTQCMAEIHGFRSFLWILLGFYGFQVDFCRFRSKLRWDS